MKVLAGFRTDGWLALAASVLVCFGVWRWANHILAPANTVSAQHKGVPIGNNSDLYPRWLGARELLLHRRDPYSADVTREIQKGFYGRVLDPNNRTDPMDQAAFAYPLYVVFVLAPTVTLPFAIVQAVFRWCVLLGFAASVPLWMYAIGFRVRPFLILSGMLLTASSYPAVLEFYMQNLSGLVAILLALAAAALVRNWLLLAGFLLALSTIKPQLSALFVLWFLLWAAGRWRERWRLVLGFAGTFIALVLAAEIASPHWIPRFATAVRSYRMYANNPSILEFFLGTTLSWVVAAALCCGLLFLGWRRRGSPAGSEDFAWVLAWVAIVALTLVPVSAYNQVLLIPPLLVLLAHWDGIRKSGLLSRALVKAAFACQGWQWGTAVILALCSFLVSAERLRTVARLPAGTLLALPPITLLAVMVATFSRRPECPAIPPNPGGRHE